MLKSLFTSVAVAATPFLLAAALTWALRARRTVPFRRWVTFLAGLMSSSLAYAAHFLLRSYLRTAHLEFWAQVDTIVGIGGLMFLFAFAALVASFFGKGYGRIAACLASIFVATLWWITRVASL